MLPTPNLRSRRGLSSRYGRRCGERREASAILAVRRPSWAASSIRSTIHVGEDFVRLTQGLWRIHEPIEYGLLRVGDRIGHGLALGIDPKQWASQLHQTPKHWMSGLMTRCGSSNVIRSKTFLLRRSAWNTYASRSCDLLAGSTQERAGLLWMI